MKKHQESGGSKEERMQARLSNILLGSAIVIYALSTFFTMLHHEPWRDEAHPWLVARDASLMDIFRLRPYDWHPVLWYLMLAPLAKLGLPFLSSSILHLALAVVIVVAVLWKAPFSRLTKILFVFSYYMFWQYSIDVRVYTIGVFLLVAIALLYPRRFDFPISYAGLVFLLFNTNAHMSFMAGGLLATFGWEAVAGKRVNSRTVAAAMIMAAGALGLAFQLGVLFPRADNMYSGNVMEGHASFKAARIVEAMSKAFFVGAGPMEALAPVAFVVLGLAFYALLLRPAAFCLLALHLAGILWIFCTHNGDLRHYGLIVVGMLFCLWIARCYEDRSPAPFVGGKKPLVLPAFDRRVGVCLLGLNLCLLASMAYGFRLHILDRKFNFSGSREMAKVIQVNKLDQWPIASHRAAQTSSILAYLPGKKFWYAEIGRYGSYIKQDKEHLAGSQISNAEALKKIEQAFPDQNPLFVVLDTPLEGDIANNYKLLYKVDSTVFGSDERYYLYVRNTLGGGGIRQEPPGTVPVPRAGG